jgi:transcriptional regulator with XRE-family HTH domain
MISNKIKEIRERNNLSKEYIAIQMEISIKKYNEIEKGKVDLKISKLKRLSEILGVEKTDFFIGLNV